MSDAPRALFTAAVAATATFVFAGTADARTSALHSADAPAAQLQAEDTTDVGSSEVTQYSQEVGGVPVVGAGVTVLDSPGEPAEVLFDKSVSGIGDPAAPSVSRAAGIAAALAAIGDPRRGDTSARLVIDAERGNQLAWEVTHVGARTDWLITVSAASGEVIGKLDRIRDATGQASVFLPNAVVANNSYNGIKDRQDDDSSALTALRTPVGLEEIVDGQDCLKGAWVNARVSPERKKVCKGSLDWTNVTREANRFEALMVYYHVTEVQQYIQTLGLDPINEERQDVFANTFSADNSFYSPGSDKIELGTGGVDDAEDADVIIHEYGHAVQDAQAPQAFSGGGNAAGAMGEGFGDYLAAAYQTDQFGADPEWTPCIMEWDATSYDFDDSDGICLRRADDPDSRPDQADECGGAADIHCVGQAWSSALLDLRNTLGDDGGGDSTMDTLVLASHELLPPAPSFSEAADAIMDADSAIYSGSHCGDLADEFNDREFGTFAC